LVSTQVLVVPLFLLPSSGLNILFSNAYANFNQLLCPNIKLISEIQVYGVQGSQEPQLSDVILQFFAKYASTKIEGCSK